MAGHYYLGDRPDQSDSLFRKILIGVCLAVLICAAVVFFILYSSNAKISRILPAFESALDSREYEKALTMYRGIQAQVLEEDPDKAASDTQ